jgi:type IX secretion system PorP/SprF family membrane protein
MKKIYLLIALIGGAFTSKAQDLHFSQFWAAPMNINPALTGSSSSDIRAISLYRTQWRAISEPYNTIGVTADAMLPPKRAKNDFWGGGINFNSDKSGLSQASLTQGNLSLAYHKILDNRQTNVFSVGFMTGFGQRAINYQNLTWDSQYNGVRFDPTLPTNETLSDRNTLMYVDLSAGINWLYEISKHARLSIGGSMFHLNRPNLSFTRIEEDKQSFRYTLNANLQILSKKYSNTSFLPSLLYMQQGPQRLINAGGAIRYRLQDRSKYTGYASETAIAFGAFYRLQDAAYLNFRVEYGDFSAGLAYDVNVSGLSVATNGRGGMELMVRYTKSIYGSGRNNPKAGLKFVQE